MGANPALASKVKENLAAAVVLGVWNSGFGSTYCDINNAVTRNAGRRARSEPIKKRAAAPYSSLLAARRPLWP
jgi:hypothetical protein